MTKPRMKKWTDAKLELELGFAVLSNDNSPECKAWLAAINAEIDRRRDAGSDEWSGGVTMIANQEQLVPCEPETK